MGLKDIIGFVKQKIQERKAIVAKQDMIPDDVTRDRYLRSLRRERRTQLEEMEKQRLKVMIENYKKERSRKMMYGINNNLPRQFKNNKVGMVKVRKSKRLRSGFMNQGII